MRPERKQQIAEISRSTPTLAERRIAELETENERLRKALSAYRSALRSGERETDQLREFGDRALERTP